MKSYCNLQWYSAVIIAILKTLVMKKLIVLTCFTIILGSLKAEEKKVMTSDGVQLYVNVKGSGPACLYIHGGPGSGSYWMENLFGEFLEQHFQMVYLDQRGVGRSSSPADSNYKMERMVKDFEEVRNSLGLHDWLILGHSFGGLLQMGYVNKVPDAIKGMLFINCTLFMEDSFGNSWLPKAIELAGKDVPYASTDASLSLFQRMNALIPVLNEKNKMWQIFFEKEENMLKMNETYSKFASWNSDLSENIMEVDDYWCDFGQLTPAIHKPVLFFYGKKDWAVGPEHYKRISFPNMMLYGADSGHMPFLEDRKNLEKSIRMFLEKYRF